MLLAGINVEEDQNNEVGEENVFVDCCEDNENEDDDDEVTLDELSASQQSTLSPLTGKGMGTGSLSSSSLSSTASTTSTSSTASSSSLSSTASSSESATSKKRVSFGPTDIKECLHHQDMTYEERDAVWYTFQDFQRLKDDRRALVKLMDQFDLKETKDGGVAVSLNHSSNAALLPSSSSSSSTTPTGQLPNIDDSIRGLEYRTKDGKRKRHSEIQSVIRAVLNEQSKSSLLSSCSSRFMYVSPFHRHQPNHYNNNNNGSCHESLTGENRWSSQSVQPTPQQQQPPNDPALAMAVLCEMYTKHNIAEAHKRGLSDQQDVLSLSASSSSSGEMTTSSNEPASADVDNQMKARTGTVTATAATTTATSNKGKNSKPQEEGDFFIVSLEDGDHDDEVGNGNERNNESNSHDVGAGEALEEKKEAEDGSREVKEE